MYTKHFTGLIFLLAIVALALPVVAQSEFRQTYTSDDGQFTFTYASDLTITVQPREGSLNIGEFYIDADEPLRVEVSPPTTITELQLNGFGNTPRQIINNRMALWRQVAPLMTNSVVEVPSDAFAAPLRPIEEYLINGRQAAYSEQLYMIDGVHAVGVIMIAVDLGNNHIVTITASPSLHDGAAILEAHRDSIIEIARTLDYTPNHRASRRSAMPLTSYYENSIGHLFTGDLGFTYPKDWYILPISGNVFVTNTDRLVSSQIESGMVQVNIIPPDFNMTAFFDHESIAECNIAPEQAADITPERVIEVQMLNEARLASYEEQNATYSDVESLKIDGRDMAYMYLFTPERDALVVAVDMGGGHVVSMMVFAYVGEMVLYADTIFALASTLDYAPRDCQ
ncbi:MAG: hypothetical protein EA396_05195 [Anaerolineaceae bacterium]|nr:MAG: hypothetical protein EA396_05195 [Anaerolineaceae bacterium]